jgi:hypothetical protein
MINDIDIHFSYNASLATCASHRKRRNAYNEGCISVLDRIELAGHRIASPGPPTETDQTTNLVCGLLLDKIPDIHYLLHFNSAVYRESETGHSIKASI